jgi:urease accessory protein UreE
MLRSPSADMFRPNKEDNAASKSRGVYTSTHGSENSMQLLRNSSLEDVLPPKESKSTIMVSTNLFISDLSVSY